MRSGFHARKRWERLRPRRYRPCSGPGFPRTSSQRTVVRYRSLFFSFGAFGISVMSLICNNTPIGPENTAPFGVRLTARRRVGMTMPPNAVPRLAVFLVWPALTGLEAGFGAHERSRQVVPQCVAHEGELLQFIPGCGQDVPGERSPWRGTLLNDATLGLLDPYAVWRKVPGARRATERRDRDTRPVSLDTQCHVAQAVRKPREPPQPAANGHLELEGFHLPPPRQAAVRVKGAGEQVFHAVSSRLVILPMHSHLAETCICMYRPKKELRLVRQPGEVGKGSQEARPSPIRHARPHALLGALQRRAWQDRCRTTTARHTGLPQHRGQSSR